MGALSFVQAIAFDSNHAPYANLFRQELKAQLITIVTKEYCLEKNLS